MKLYLHIGTEKTGTTSIQDFLVANESKLFDLGYGISKVSGIGNNRKLAAFSMRDERSDDFFEASNLTTVDARVQFKKHFREEFESELQNLAENVHSVIISSEHFHSRCVNEDELQKLKALLVKYFDEINVICYFRPQVELATSLYSTALRVGFTHTAVEFISNELRLDNYYYNYLDIYQNWVGVFGKSNMNVRLYGKQNFRGGDLMEDFCYSIGLDYSTCGFSSVPSSNKSINHIGQLMLRRLNDSLSRNESADNEIRRQFVSWLESKYDGKGFRCPYETEVKLQQKFDEVNRAVLHKAGYGASKLFSIQPSRGDLDDSSVAQDLIDVTLELWKEKSCLTDHEINVIRDSAVELEGKNVSAAIELMKLAQKFRPEGTYIKNKLATYEEKVGRRNQWI
ncbi:hypothetical protein [Microbulbifer sp. Q7]|uniref:hypothetical protein n=1 Tax=Microbulbifer sp. Q7 TaxID=1785091 RepID=UPI000836DD26|nr:hypothetical protein [Microbulbifer sp. Q7]